MKREDRFVGFEVDICRAIAAAIFGDANRIQFVTLKNISQFKERKEIDLVVRRLTWTLKREVESDVAFGPVIFYDGQGFLVRKAGGISRISQLAGQRICVIDMERHPQTLYRHFKDSGGDVQLVLVESDQEAELSLRRNGCRAYSADTSWLAAARAGFADGLTRYEILSEFISKEPLAPMVREQDINLLQLVRLTIFAMIEAEELGLNSHNIDEIKPASSRVEHFLSIRPDGYTGTGTHSWVRAIIAGVGNYGEVFDRNLGDSSSIKLDRGANRLWTSGGLLYAPPLDR